MNVSSLSLCVPVLRDIDSAYLKAQLLRQMDFKGPLLVSINDSARDLNDDETSLFKNLGCTVYTHRQNLGLYGNFKFLADNTNTSHFAWVALDDIPSRDILKDWLPNLSATLTIGRIEVRNYSAKEHGRLLESISTDAFFESNPFSINPSFLFGIWKTDFIRTAWTEKSMDWLDTYILLQARIQGPVETIVVEDPWIIGATNKSPHKVNGKFHLPIMWGLEVFKLDIFQLKKGLLGFFSRALWGRIIFSVSEIILWIASLPIVRSRNGRDNLP
jgi:hypothetical protein